MASAFQGFRFKLGGIPVLVRPGFFMLPAIGASNLPPTQAALAVAIVLGSILLHELGHAIAMRGFGRTASIELHMMGGLTFWQQDVRPSVSERLIVSLAGPGIQLVPGVVAFAAWRYGAFSPETQWALRLLVFVNIGWALVNLLPVLPWDGGNSFDALLELLTGRPRPRLVGWVSLVIGALVVAFALWERWMMLGYLGGMGILYGFRRQRSASLPEPLPEGR